ncbi:MAG: hypothetical protein N2Z62_12050 [Rhodobacteraceae bacterium]|nr:hypothetical protein [Paracoccaceae bacterium]
MNAMIGTEAQKRSFRDRLTRIEQGGENTTRHVYVGPVDEAVGARPRKVQRVRTIRATGPRRRLLTELFMVPFALLAGAASVIATRVAFFHYLGALEPLQGAFRGVALTTIAAAGMALLLFVLLRLLFNLRGGARGKAALAGLLATALFEELAMVRVPGLFALIYSPEHVGQVIAPLG